MPWSSNATFLVDLCLDGEEGQAVYKPGRGEQELWDFPPQLYRREVAAWVLSEALGWGVVPETIVRTDGPLGQGSLQRFVPADFTEHYFTLMERPEFVPALRRIAAFDLLANNADRKAGHCLLGEDGGIWAIDHGLCFHHEFKLRTVMWDFAGEELDDDVVADIAGLSARGLPEVLHELLSPSEVRAIAVRVEAVLAEPVYPPPSSRRSFPWPMV
jgi:uncharacterized repeat protein (TIGR03843 family)